MKSTLYFFFTGLLFFYLFVPNNNSESFELDNNKIKLCSELSYEDSLNLHPKNFGKFNISLRIHNERKWRRIIIEEEIKRKRENKSREHFFYTNRKRVDASFQINIKPGLKCTVLARIRPHGDLWDHRKGSGLASLNVSLKNGHLFGIVDFILLRPITRNYDNEIFTTTLLRELNQIAPRSSKVNVNYRGVTEEFIFQEKIAKELLENSSLREGAIFEGDERFHTYDPFNTINLSRHRLINKNWARKQDSNETISEIGLSILNEINQYHRIKDKNITQIDLVDYHAISKKIDIEHYFDKLPIYDALMFATEGSHGLNREDRRFYFDATVRKFYPIYYDSTSYLLANDNKILDLPILEINELKNKPNIRFGKVIPSAISGSDAALKSLKLLKTESLHSKLIKNGVNLEKEKVQKLIEIIKKRLSILKNFSKERVFNVETDMKSRSFMSSSFIDNKKIKRRLIYYDAKFKEYLSCNIYGENCKRIILSKKAKIKALAQELKKEEINFIFVGKERKKSVNQGWFSNYIYDHKISKNQIKEENFADNVKIISYGNINYSIDSSSKTVKINKNDLSGRVVFYGGKINNWKIILNDNSNMISPGNDINGLTGCLSFFDIKLENLSIESTSSYCEDAVNFVRSNGSIKNLLIKDSIFDAVDADFSNLNFDIVDIKNSQNDCVDLSFGKYFLNQTKVEYCGDKGISVGEDSNVEINNLFVSNSNTGLASKDFSIVKIDSGKINSTKYCIEVYNKKQEFSGGFVFSDKMMCENSHKNSLVDEKSLLKVNFL